MKELEKIEAVVFGGSAGSISVLVKLLQAFPAQLRIPVIICVHRMKNAAEGIQEVLQANTPHRVIEPEDKLPVLGGCIYVAPSNYHMLVARDLTFNLSTDRLVNFSRPSIDLTLCSAATAYRGRLAGILLTGANKDGAEGMDCISKSGGITIVQDLEECTAPFMPQAALEKSCVDHIFSLEQITAFIREAAGGNLKMKKSIR